MTKLVVKLAVLYCILAAVAAIVLMVMHIKTTRFVQEQLYEQTQLLQGIEAEHEKARIELEKLKLHQKTNRGGFSNEEAIESSVTVQAQQTVFDEVDTRLDQAKSDNEELSERLKLMTRRLLPWIVMFLVHAILFLILLPRWREAG